jgi:hypothetical protein
MKEDKVSRGCSNTGRGEILIKFQSINIKGRDHLGFLGVGGRIILKYILRE